MIKPDEIDVLDEQGKQDLARLERQVDAALKSQRGVAWVQIPRDWDFRLWPLLAARYEREGWQTTLDHPQRGEATLIIHHPSIDPSFNRQPVDLWIPHPEPEIPA